MAKIAILNDDLINKIAAGEVVDRPASVVKELCENAIDAGAKSISVRLRGSGLEEIFVADDGCGMSPEDAELALCRHATSKLRDAEGLFSICTQGFRGEALPAIASVSHFSLVTSEAKARLGTRVQKSGEGPIGIEAAPAAGGTQVTVAELFFNTPARRKFLRRNETELKQCQEAILRLALGNPGIAFRLEHDGRLLFSASPCASGREKDRVLEVLGTELAPALWDVEERRLGISVRGHIASPDYSRPTANSLYTFVNGRYVRDRNLNHAISRAFSEFLPPGRQPIAALYLEVDPRSVDVNVHPQKLEVRFADNRGVYDALHAAVSRAIHRDAPPPSPSGPSQSPAYASAVQQFLARAHQAAWGAPLPMPSAHEGEGRLGFGQLRPGLNEAPPPGYFGAAQFLGFLRKKFWVCEASDGSLLALDPHAAFERIHWTAFRAALGERRPQFQRALFSSVVTVNAQVLERLTKHLDALLCLGIELAPFGGTSLALKAVPNALMNADFKWLLEQLAELLPSDETAEGAYHAALKLLACCAAEQGGRLHTPAEIASALAELDGADFRAELSHPSIVLLEAPLFELERKSRAPQKQS